MNSNSPLPEQRAIVSKIEQLFSELDNGIANLKAAQQKLEIYRQAVLKKAFEGELTKAWREQQTNLPTADELLEQIKKEREAYYQQQLKDWQQSVIAWYAQGRKGKKPGKPKLIKQIESVIVGDLIPLPNDWRWVTFSDLGFWTGGGTPSKSVADYWNEGSLLWISPKDMKSKVINNTIDKITYAAVGNSSAKLIDKGSVVFVVRSGILRRILPIATTNQQSTVNQDLQALTPFVVNTNFIYWYSVSNEHDIRKTCAKDGTTVESVESSTLKQYKFALCSTEEQNQIVREIESRFSVCDKLASTIENNLQKAEALRQSILKKAFEGKLLSEAELEACRREPDWEPAEQLLERIKGEKQAVPTTGNLFES